MVRLRWIAADRSFASGLTPPCGCIGTCRLDSHTGRTARGSVVGEIDNVPSENIAESVTESIASTVRATPWDPSRWAALVGRAVARGSGALGGCTDPWHRDGGLALPLCDALTLGLSRISCQALCYDYAYDR